jgi:hypothetical protein
LYTSAWIGDLRVRHGLSDHDLGSAFVEIGKDGVALESCLHHGDPRCRPARSHLRAKRSLTFKRAASLRQTARSSRSTAPAAPALQRPSTICAYWALKVGIIGRLIPVRQFLQREVGRDFLNSRPGVSYGRGGSNAEMPGARRRRRGRDASSEQPWARWPNKNSRPKMLPAGWFACGQDQG